MVVRWMLRMRNARGAMELAAHVLHWLAWLDGAVRSAPREPRVEDAGVAGRALAAQHAEWRPLGEAWHRAPRASSRPFSGVERVGRWRPGSSGLGGAPPALDAVVD